MSSHEIIHYTPIGIIHSPFDEPRGTPIQSVAARGVEGTVEVFPAYSDGLQDIQGFSHLLLLYHFHRARQTSLTVTPFMHDQPHGVFSTRAPNRPNAIGISIVQMVRKTLNVLHVTGLDIVDGTPLLDIKPYVPEIDQRDTDEIGWLRNSIHRLDQMRDDGRFTR